MSPETPAERRLRSYAGECRTGRRDTKPQPEEIAAIDMGREALALLREWDALTEWDGKVYAPEDEVIVRVRALLARAGEES